MFMLKDGVTACVPSTNINQLAILPCIEQYDGQFFDTKCELASVLFMKFQYFNFNNLLEWNTNMIVKGRVFQ